MISEQYKTIAGHRLRIVGNLENGLNPLVILNGIGASAGLLRPLMLELEVPSITFDLPGIGASAPSFVPRRMSDLARLAARVLDTLNIKRSPIMGISWGGTLAQQFAYQYPHRTQHLILAATSIGQLSVPPSPLVLMEMATPLRYLSARHFVSVAGRIYGGDFRRNPKLALNHAKHMTPPSMSGYLNQLFAISNWTSLFWLHNVEAPTLVMAGTDDPIVPQANARMLVNRLPNGTLSTFDCGHLFFLTRANQVSRRIERFLSEAGGIMNGNAAHASHRPNPKS